MNIWIVYSIKPSKNNTAVTIHVQVFVGIGISIFLGTYLGEELLGQMVIVCLTFWDFTRLISTAAAPFYIPNNIWRF